MMVEWALFPYKASEEQGEFKEENLGWYIRFDRTRLIEGASSYMYYDYGRTLTAADGRPTTFPYSYLEFPSVGSLGTVKPPNKPDPIPMTDYLRKPKNAPRGSRTRFFVAEGDQREYCWTYRKQDDEPDIIWRCASKEGYEWAVFMSPPPGESHPPTLSINPECGNIVKDLFLSLHIMLYMQKHRLF